MLTPKWIMICDESGAKGFSDKPANNDEQIGVVAGLLLSAENYDTLIKKLPNIIAKYEPSDGTKLHVTDLETDKQESIRDDIFELIKESDGHIVYEAITQDGAHKWYNTEKKYWGKLKEDGRIRGFGYSFSDHKKRLHVELFQGCFNRAMAFIEDSDPTDYKFSIDVLTDTIDTPVLDEIKSNITRFLTFDPAQKEETTASRFNYDTKSVEKT